MVWPEEYQAVGSVQRATKEERLYHAKRAESAIPFGQVTRSTHWNCLSSLPFRSSPSSCILFSTPFLSSLIPKEIKSGEVS